jgi:glycosyltransferase involved in cell wall biosynthesis
VHSVSVVVPVYRGEHTLEATVADVLRFGPESLTPGGTAFGVTEIILVHDNGPDRSDEVIRRLAAAYPSVRPIWLSTNFGQHAATLAGMAASTSDWVVTIDEDGQQDPADIGGLLDAALTESVQLVYGHPLNPAPHGPLRNAASHFSKFLIAQFSGSRRALDFNSFRLVLGSVAREAAKIAGPGVYLDVALGWISGPYTTTGISLRGEQRASGYSLRSLLSHFWRLVITSGTRMLRLVSIAGVAFAIIGVLFALWIVIVKIFFGIDSQGWASIIVIMLLSSGGILFVLGVIAEYIGANVNKAMGKPLYFVTTDRADGPLGLREKGSTGNGSR